MTEMTGGELLLRALHAENVEHIHAITDGTYMIFLEALERLGEEFGMNLVVPRHEAAAAHAADGYARVTGKPGVVMACAGPGAANLLSGVICAQAEGVPLVAITTIRRSDVSDNYRHMGGTQSPDHVGLFRQAVKWAGRVDHWQRIPDMVRHAFRVATSGAPGPVYLGITEEALNARNDASDIKFWSPERYRIASPMSAPSDLVQQAAEKLVAADFVNIHCGGGATRSGAGDVILELAEYLGAAVTCNISARGIIPETHPQFFAPLSQANFASHLMADSLLAVGTRFGELAMWGKSPAWRDPDMQYTVQIDSEPTNIGVNRPINLGLIGDARTVVGQILDAVKQLTEPRPPHQNLMMLRHMQNQWQEKLDEITVDRDRSPMVSGQLVEVCNEVFPDDAIVSLDGGNTVMWLQNYLKPQAQRSVLYTANFGYLGTGLPFALGAKLAAPDRPVFCVTGDSAFGFNIQELESAVRTNLPVVVIVAVDGAYGMEKTAQQRVFGREAPWFMHDHAPVRYDKVAEAMGCYGECVSTANELGPAIERAMASGKPAVIHAYVDPDANITPPGSDLWAAARSGNFKM